VNSAPALIEDIRLLEEKLKTAKIPDDLHQKTNAMVERLVKFASS